MTQSSDTARTVQDKPWWLGLLRIAGIIYALACVLLYVFQEKLIYVPFAELARTPAAVLPHYEDVWLETRDGAQLHGWFVSASTPAAPYVIFFHGNAGNMAGRVPVLEYHHRLEHHVLMIDYRGFGQSSGEPSEAGTAMDALTAWNYLTDKQGASPERIVIHGRSLGAAVALQLARQVQAAAVILESPFTSLPDVASDVYPLFPVRWLARIQYPNLEAVRALDTPILVAHSPDDDLIPYSHGQDIADARPGIELLNLAGDHNSGSIVWERRYDQTVKDFIHKHTAGRRGS